MAEKQDGIAFRHPEYEAKVKTWKKINDFCDGENLDEYLVWLNPDDNSVDNDTRNKQYRARAVFYGISGYTARGLNGLLFSKTPKLEIPATLEYVKEDVDGSGNSIYQQAQYAARNLIRNGRAGLVVAFPKVAGNEDGSNTLTRADMSTGRFIPTIHLLNPSQIINWRTAKIGAQQKISLVVLAEIAETIGADGYTIVNKPILRELALNTDSKYFERIWEQNQKGDWVAIDTAVPVDGKGNPWDEIPFTFLGSENNDPSVDQPPMLDIVRVNEGHFHNSADFEDSVWFCGQNQPWMSGITQGHIDLMKANNMYVGSRNLLGVPSGEQFGFASAEPNSLVRQAMIDKIDLAIGLGARFIQPSGPARTATEAAGDQEVQHSVLSLISENLGDGYTRCLRWCGKYLNIDAETAVFEPNKEFVKPTATAQDIQAIVAGWMGNAIPTSEMIKWFQQRQIITPEKTIEEIMDELGNMPSMPNMEA